MIWSQSHDFNGVDQGFAQVVNNSATSIARGNGMIWDIAAPAGKKGLYVVISPATAANHLLSGCAEDAFTVPAGGGADLTRVGLMQVYGYHDAVTFTGTAAAVATQAWLCTAAVAGTFGMVTATTPTGAQLGGLLGICLTNGGTPATVEAIIQKC